MPDEGAITDEATHVDRVLRDPFSGATKLLGRLPSKDDPAIGGQERDGWATYVYISEPHTMAACPFRLDGEREGRPQVPGPAVSRFMCWLRGHRWQSVQVTVPDSPFPMRQHDAVMCNRCGSAVIKGRVREGRP